MDGCDWVGYISYILLKYNSQLSIQADWNDKQPSTYDHVTHVLTLNWCHPWQHNIT